MDYGDYIDNHLELIRIDDHYDIYISRRSLKHFVESRKKEMVNSHTKDEILNKLYFAVDNIINVFKNCEDFFIQEDGRFIYIKYFTELTKHSLRIVLESNDNRLDVCSIHFQKRKKPP
jgi:hypothetical protein